MKMENLVKAAGQEAISNWQLAKLRTTNTDCLYLPYACFADVSSSGTALLHFRGTRERTFRARLRNWSSGLFLTASPCPRIFCNASSKRSRATAPIVTNRKGCALLLAIGK